MALVRQEGGALHEEWRKRGEREVGHGIGRVFAPPRVRQGLAVAVQRGDEAVLDLYPHVESEIALRENRTNRMDGRLSGGCCIRDSPARASGLTHLDQTGETSSNATRTAK